MLQYILLCSLTLQACPCHPAPCTTCMSSCVAGYSPLAQWLSSPVALHFPCLLIDSQVASLPMQVAALPPWMSYACISSRIFLNMQMDAEKVFVEWAMSEGRIVVHPTTCYGVRECGGNSTFDQSCHWGTEGRYVCLRCVLTRNRALALACFLLSRPAAHPASPWKGTGRCCQAAAILHHHSRADGRTAMMLRASMHSLLTMLPAAEVRQGGGWI